MANVYYDVIIWLYDYAIMLFGTNPFAAIRMKPNARKKKKMLMKTKTKKKKKKSLFKRFTSSSMFKWPSINSNYSIQFQIALHIFLAISLLFKFNSLTITY